MTATVKPARTAWWDANGDLIELAGSKDGFGRWVPKADAALASLVGGPADGRAGVMIRGSKPPVIVGKRTEDGLMAWYTRDDRPPKLTYQYAGSLRGWPRVIPA
jgi:hypothetical protein